MSSFAVTLERVTVRPHPNADRLELARVGLFDAVVGKDSFKTGDVVFYIPEQAILPEDLISTLSLDGKLAGPQKNRVKAVKLRGALSQGIVAKLDILDVAPDAPHYDGVLTALMDAQHGVDSAYDFAPALGVEKWEPEIPAHMSGQVESGARMLSWVDIENIKRYPNIFAEGEPVWVTEKIHGTCLLATVALVNENETYAIQGVTVSSKGLAEKHLALTEDENNLYWRAVNAYPVRELALEIAGHFAELSVESVGIYGEVYGSGVQDLAYGVKGNTGKPGFAVFDARVKLTNGTDFWVNSGVVHGEGVLTTDIPKVPTLFVGPYNIEEIAKIASGKEQVSGTEANLREGVVIRPVEEGRSEVVSGRKIAKFVTEEYLTRKGGTEYQ
jgi:RNA ligase (TIGR02306 family)